MALVFDVAEFRGISVPEQLSSAKNKSGPRDDYDVDARMKYLTVAAQRGKAQVSKISFSLYAPTDFLGLNCEICKIYYQCQHQHNHDKTYFWTHTV